MMKVLCVFILLFPLLSGCSLIGANIGKEVDKSFLGDADNKHKYESQYMVEGLEADVELVKAIFSKPVKERPFFDPDPCKDDNSIQVCTVKKGCWCEVKDNYQ